MAEEAVVNEDKPQCCKLKTYYYKYFPTDGFSYTLRIPYIGLILSVLNFHACFVCWLLWDIRSEAFLINGLYIFVVFGVSYELHYGLKTMDSTQLTPWLILKYIEIFVGALLFGISASLYLGLLVGLNFAVTRAVFKKFQSFRREVVASEKIPQLETV